MNELRVLRAEGWERWPWLVHGFTERAGGVSPFPENALNLGRTTEDDPANVRENLRRVAAHDGFDAARVARLAQVHGTRVVVRASPEDTRRVEADAQATAVCGLVLAVLVADCVPVLLVDPVARAVAAVHAGWRPTVGRIVGRTIDAMAESWGTRPEDLWMAMGPCASPDAYEVGEEVAIRFATEFGEASGVVIRRAGARPHVDLVRANRMVAVQAGVDPARILWTGHCTIRQNDRFFSHRAERGRTGRQMGYVGMRAG